MAPNKNDKAPGSFLYRAVKPQISVEAPGVISRFQKTRTEMATALWQVIFEPLPEAPQVGETDYAWNAHFLTLPMPAPAKVKKGKFHCMGDCSIC